MRPIVHIGYHKTATTWFQGQVYPHALSHRWIPRAVARKALLDPHGLCFDAAQARKLFAHPTDGRAPIICEENLSGYIHNAGLHGMLAPEAARRIKEVFPDAVIVIMVRAQPEMVAATYVQYVRGGGTHGVRRYLFAARYVLGAFRHAYKAPRFAFEHFEYDRLIRLYDDLFGAENVIVQPYERLRADREEFLDELCRTTGLRLDRKAIGHRPSNKSFGIATIWLGRLLGLLTARSVMDKAYLISIPGLYEIRRLALKLAAAIDPTPSGVAVLPRSIIDHVRRFYGASNRRLAQLRDIDLEALGYPMGDGAVPPAAPSPMQEDGTVIPISAAARLRRRHRH